jgi:hypothetical protein
MIEINMGGLCEECVVLHATAEITDKDGRRLSLKDQVYTHHIIAVDKSRMLNMAPIVPNSMSSLTCAAGKLWDTLLGKTPAAQSSKPNSMAHGSQGSPVKRSPQVSGWPQLTGEWGAALPGVFSLFIAKGNEGDSTIFAAPETSQAQQVKSGYWLGKNDKILGIAEVVSYKPVPQDVYLSIDYHYVPINGPRPPEYLDAGLGVIMTEECGDLNLRELVPRLALTRTDISTRSPKR